MQNYNQPPPPPEKKSQPRALFGGQNTVGEGGAAEGEEEGRVELLGGPLRGRGCGGIRRRSGVFLCCDSAMRAPQTPRAAWGCVLLLGGTVEPAGK